MTLLLSGSGKRVSPSEMHLLCIHNMHNMHNIHNIHIHSGTHHKTENGSESEVEVETLDKMGEVGNGR